MMMNYTALALEAAKLGLPLSFKGDLTLHDYKACERAGDDRRFIWAIGPTGTNLVWLDPCYETFTTRKARDLIDTFLKYDREHLYLWDGSRLGAITPDTAVQILTAGETDVVRRYGDLPDFDVIRAAKNESDEKK